MTPERQEECLLDRYMEDYEKAIEWVKKISKYGEYINGNKNWTDDAGEYIPILEEAIEKAIRYDDLCE